MVATRVGTLVAFGSVVLLAACGSDSNNQMIDAAMGSADAAVEADAQVFGPAGWDLSASKVGLAAMSKTCAGLPMYTGRLMPASGATISDMRIVGTLQPQTTGTGFVTIERSCLQGHIVGGNVAINDSEIVGSAPTTDRAFEGGLVDISRSYIHNVSVGAWFASTSSSNLRVIIEDSVIETTGIALEVQVFTGTNVEAVIRRNRLIGTSATSPVVFVGTYVGNIANLTFERNLIEGAGQLSSLEQTSGKTTMNLDVKDNRFTDGTNTVTGTTWNVWSSNYAYSATGIDGKGAAIPAP